MRRVCDCRRHEQKLIRQAVDWVRRQGIRRCQRSNRFVVGSVLEKVLCVRGVLQCGASERAQHQSNSPVAPVSRMSWQLSRMMRKKLKKKTPKNPNHINNNKLNREKWVHAGDWTTLRRFPLMWLHGFYAYCTLAQFHIQLAGLKMNSAPFHPMCGSVVA